MTRLAVFATHPIQYQVPLWRNLELDPSIDLHVYYFSDHGLGGAVDEGFGEKLTWDVPLLEGYKSTFLSRRPISELDRLSLPNAREFLDQNNFDVALLHGYTHTFARQIVRGAKAHGYKILLRGEFTDMQRRRPGLRSIAKEVYLRWFYPYVDHFLPIGRDAQAHLGRFKIQNDQITLAPYSVDDELIKKQLKESTREHARRQLDLSDNAQVVIFSGKMIPRKQPLLLLNAFRQLKDEFPDLVPAFLGSGEQYEELLQGLERDFPGRYIAPGFVNQSKLGEYFMAADLFVLPSTYDTWGLVVNEAMHFGLPCLVSNMVGSGRDLVTQGETGDTFAFDSEDQLVTGLRQLLGDREKLKTMGVKASQRVEDYSIAATVAGLRAGMRKSLDLPASSEG